MSHSITSQAATHNNIKLIKGIKPAEPSAKLQQNVQPSENLTTKVRKPQSVRGVDKFLIKCVYHGKGIHARKFCRRWFGMEDLDKYGRPRYTEAQILAMESDHGYREKCINLIAKVLKIKPNTVHRWGKGVEFNKIPPDKQEQYEMYLGYVDIIRLITLSIAGLNEDLLLQLLHRLEEL